jgi:hypothetical protein
VLQTAYNGGCTSYGSIEETEVGEIDCLGRRPGSPYIAAGPCYMQKCGVLLARVAKSPREGKASKLGLQSYRSC